MTAKLHEADMIVGHSIEAKVAIFRAQMERIRKAFTEIHEAQAELGMTFGRDAHGLQICMRSLYSFDEEQYASVHEQMERGAWILLVAQSGVRGVMSISACEQMDRQLSNDKLPELTAENIRGLMATHRDKAGGYLADAVREVRDYLTPQRGDYKTNSKFDVGRRVVLTGMVERKYSGTGWSVRSWGRRNDDILRALDRVFLLLDGKAPPKTYQGPLHNSIVMSNEDNGRTDYFAWKAFKNGNLHLEFLRMDLVEALNAVAGGNNLYHANHNTDRA